MRRVFCFLFLFVIKIYAQNTAFCGDGFCSFSEDCLTCSVDCGSCCGDDFCNSKFEDCVTCSDDCGECQKVCHASFDRSPESISETCFSKQDCNNDECDTSVLCSPLEKVSCGDSICNKEQGEACSTCPLDCGSCDISCGDKICQENQGETCSSCDTDCGNCPENPTCSLPVDISASYEKDLGNLAFSTPEILGTKLRLALNGNLSGSIGESAEQCAISLSSSAGLSACPKLLGLERCLTTELSASGECSAPIRCLNGPAFACDLSNTCCTASITGKLNFKERYSIDVPYGPFSCDLGLAYSLSASLNAANAQVGFSNSHDSCPFMIEELKFSTGLSLTGDGNCKIEFAGQSYNANAHLTGSLCLNQGEWEIPKNAGINLDFAIEMIAFSYFTISPWNGNFNAGDSCE